MGKIPTTVSFFAFQVPPYPTLSPLLTFFIFINLDFKVITCSKSILDFSSSALLPKILIPGLEMSL